MSTSNNNAPTTPSKTTRVELEWVQFCTPARSHRQLPLGEEVIVATDQTKLYLAGVAGIPCVYVENEAYPSPARIPLSNVAAFGLKESKKE